nr:uncharacterized protein LOC107411598 isoform X2 [Ziziphus jujuba var. spinosa]
MDVDVSRWILEFLLRKCDDDGVVKKALKVIPFPNDESRLKKVVLLRAIESEVSEASVSEKILENLEMLEELDQREGTDTLDSMKAAYCAVALECTAKYLSASKPGKYFEAVRRIWRGRVSHMERSGKSRLLTEELKKNGEEVEAAIWDANVSKKLCRMNTRNEALGLLSVYLGEAWALMGPSFIEWAARLSIKDKGVDGSGVEEGIGDGVDRDRGDVDNGGNAKDGGHEVGAQSNVGVEVPEQVVVDSPERCAESGLNGLLELAVQFENRVDGNGNVSDHNPAAKKEVTTPKETRKENVGLRCKHVAAHRRHRGPARITNGGDLDPEALCNKDDSLSSADVNKARQSLKSSRMELLAVVTDPLPEAIQRSEIIISNLATKNVNHEPSLQNEGRKDLDESNSSVDKNAETIQPSDINVGDPSCSHQKNNVPRPTLMERNSTAQTYEWDDSIDGSPERNRLHLPSPKRKISSPLQKYEMTKIAKRRKIKKWSLVEEETLRDGVKKFGKGNWKLILNCYRDVFEERTEVDLKDKWRNMSRY